MAVAKGYDAANILEIQRASMRKARDGLSICERNNVLFDKIEYFCPSLAALMLIASRNNNRLSVLDFGGALGNSYCQNHAMLSYLSGLSWHVVEQLHFITAGQSEFQNGHLHFFPTIGDGWAAHRPDVVPLSGVLQYLENPTELLAQISALEPAYVLVDRTPILDYGRGRMSSRLCRPLSIRPAMPAGCLPPGTLEAALVLFYDVVFVFEVHHGTVIQVDELLARYRGMLFQRCKGTES